MQFHKMHNTKFYALRTEEWDVKAYPQQKNKAIPCIWKMHAFKLNITVDIIAQIYKKMLMIE